MNKKDVKQRLINDQARYIENIQIKGYNIVTCPDCGSVFICDIDNDILTCPHCYEVYLQSECPDLFYLGWKEVV